MALGVIALNYGCLEGLFESIFGAVTEMDQEHVSALFQRIPNNIRQDILSELMAKKPLPDSIKDLVKHFCDGFKICAANRHAVMHSHSGGTVASQSRDHYGFVLTKISRAGNRLVCTPTLPDLRRAADAMNEYVLFAGHIMLNLQGFWIMREKGKGSEFSLFPSIYKPPLPVELSWRAEADFRAELAPRKPSEG